jgi:signal transduction histidine kinase
VVVQSAVALDQFESDPAASRGAMVRVETLGRSALREMRGILGVLRDADADRGALTPTPGIEDIDALCARMREGGLAVSLRLETDGDGRDVPLAVGLAAYRLVQEGLTNVLKHAPTNVASVDVTLRGGALQVEVRDSGRRPAEAGATGGVGLVGMRERVTLLGGVFEAGPTADGFRVHGSIPLGEAA